MVKSSKDLLYGIVLSLSLMLVAVIIRPGSLGANDGLSYFGNHLNTLAPYTLAFGLNALFYIKASLDIDKHPLKQFFSVSLKVMAILMIGIVITPDSKFYALHTTFGTTLFLSQFIFSIYITVLKLSPENIALFLFEFIAGLASLFFLLHPDGFLLHSQILFQIGFSSLLIYSLNNFDKKQKR